MGWGFRKQVTPARVIICDHGLYKLYLGRPQYSHGCIFILETPKLEVGIAHEHFADLELRQRHEERHAHHPHEPGHGLIGNPLVNIIEMGLLCPPTYWEGIPSRIPSRMSQVAPSKWPI